MSINAHSDQVTLYKFNGGKEDWEKTEVEGRLFVFRREASPQFAFTIIKRFSEECFNNFHLPKDLEFRCQPSFLTYRNQANDRFGILFSAQSECDKVAEKFGVLVKVEQEVDQATESNLQPSSLLVTTLQSVVRLAERAAVSAEDAVETARLAGVHASSAAAAAKKALELQKSEGGGGLIFNLRLTTKNPPILEEFGLSEMG